MNNELLNFYNEELAYVRQHLSKFNHQHPGLEQDPMVEHLIQAFALCTSKMRYQLEDEYSQLSQSLLHLIYPHSLQPFPAYAIIQITPSIYIEKNSTILANTPLVVKSDHNDYHFKICYETTLTPWKINAAILEPHTQASSCLSLKLHMLNPDTNIDAHMPNNVVFFINASLEYRDAIYTLLYKNLTHIAIYNPESNQTLSLARSDLEFMGFNDSETLLPDATQSFPGHRLLKEYFHCRNKFYFFKINLEKIKLVNGYNQKINFLLYFDYHDANLARYIDHTTFALHCTPAINLFKTYAKPIQLTHQFSDYHLTPEGNTKNSYTIYNIDSVSAHTLQQTPVNIHRYFDSYYSDDATAKIFWHPYHQDDQEIFLSIIDPERQLESAPWVLSAELTCCNNSDITHLNHSPQKTIHLWQQSQEKIEIITFMTPIAAPTFPNQRNDHDWQLIHSLAADSFQIKEILKLYCTQVSNSAMIDGIISIVTETMLAPHPNLKNHGVCPGRKIKITIDEIFYQNKSWVLLMLVISEYFRMASAINQLSQLIVYNQQQEEILCCPVKAGVK